MKIHAVLLAYFFFWNLMILVSIGFLVFAIDDLLIDILYWVRVAKNKKKGLKNKKFTYGSLAEKKEQKIAVMVAAWKEADVIGKMLLHNLSTIDYKRYDVFVGLYPNDKETIDAVLAAKEEYPNIHCVVGELDGPINKAQNLNVIYDYIKKSEINLKEAYDIYVFHDSEDVVHPLSLKIYNAMSPQSDMIQIPVLPLPVKLLSFTHWVYADEFAENHTKDMIVREQIKGLVPSAGVGTAFSKETLSLLSLENHGEPFSTTSLTEDYRTSLEVRKKLLKQVFVSETVLRTQWKKRFGFFGRYVPKKVNERVATRALFPDTYMKSVIQKTRWITGIAFQEWRYSGWKGSFTTKFTLAHDRKALLAHLVNGVGYITFSFWVLYSIYIFQKPEYPTLQEMFNQYPIVWWMIVVVTLLMIQRLIQRTIAVTRVYGFLPALLVVPRAVYGNILNMHALLKAYQRFFFLKIKKGSLQKWDKTEHDFPGSHALIPYKKTLGQMLLKKGLLTQENLVFVLTEQEKTGMRFGQILLKYKMIKASDLKEVLAEQYQLQMISESHVFCLEKAALPTLKKGSYSFLLNNNIVPISFNAIKKELTLAIEDPSNEALIKQIIRRFCTFRLKFVLVQSA